jgi:hypothetical protein
MNQALRFIDTALLNVRSAASAGAAAHFLCFENAQTCGLMTIWRDAIEYNEGLKEVGPYNQINYLDINDKSGHHPDIREKGKEIELPEGVYFLTAPGPDKMGLPYLYDETTEPEKVAWVGVTPINDMLFPYGFSEVNDFDIVHNDEDMYEEIMANPEEYGEIVLEGIDQPFIIFIQLEKAVGKIKKHYMKTREIYEEEKGEEF